MNRKHQVYPVMILPVRVPWPWTPTSPYWMWTPVWTRPTVPSPRTVPAQTAPGSAFPASPADWNTTGSFPQRRSASWSAGVTPSPPPRGAPSLNCEWKTTISIYWWYFIYSSGEVLGDGVGGFHRNKNLALVSKSTNIQAEIQWPLWLLHWLVTFVSQWHVLLMSNIFTILLEGYHLFAAKIVHEMDGLRKEVTIHFWILLLNPF